ncbi:hypothetical protein [Legionella nagasakiensis]|uniref:hypothetical protein n=1 Tax=Legionella nagasakiensis TaxID=535290 RepID=UPI001056889D|nr:hypothetical protein [Legionella nagasakiensis]
MSKTSRNSSPSVIPLIKGGEVDSKPSLTTPISETTSSHLSKEMIDDIISQSRAFLESATIEDIKESYVIEWLTYAFHSSVKTKDDALVRNISSVMFELAKKDVDTLLFLLGKKFEAGKFNGQTILFVWMNELYSSTFDARNSSNIIAINYILSYVLRHATSTFADALVQPVETGREQGKSPLILMLLSLLQTAQTSFNQPSTKHIATLLLSCMTKYPTEISNALVQPINKGPFVNKHGLYLLANTLRYSAKDNPETTKIICDVIKQMIGLVASDLLTNALLTTIDKGPQQGLLPLHLILRSLVSAAYVDRNEETTKIMVDLLEECFSKLDSEEINEALCASINSGDSTYTGKNGVQMLVETLVAGLEHHQDMSSLMVLVSRLFNSNPQLMMQALIDQSDQKPPCLEFMIRKHDDPNSPDLVSSQLELILSQLTQTLPPEMQNLLEAKITSIRASFTKDGEAAGAAESVRFSRDRFFLASPTTSVTSAKHEENEDNPSPSI